jgi:WD repeat-containing protein 42A
VAPLKRPFLNIQHIYRFNIERDAVRDDDEEKEPAEAEQPRRQRRRVEGVEGHAQPDAGDDDDADAGRREDGVEEEGGEEEDAEETHKGYQQRYSGHRNQRTVKQVAFFGPR